MDSEFLASIFSQAESTNHRDKIMAVSSHRRWYSLCRMGTILIEDENRIVLLGQLLLLWQSGGARCESGTRASDLIPRFRPFIDDLSPRLNHRRRPLNSANSLRGSLSRRVVPQDEMPDSGYLQLVSTYLANVGKLPATCHVHRQSRLRPVRAKKMRHRSLNIVKYRYR